MRRAQVLLPFPGEGLFDYWVPEAVVPGQIVRVPFGRGAKLGIVWSLKADPSVPDERIKPVDAIWEGLPPLPEADRELLEFTARYYLAPLGEVVAAMRGEIDVVLGTRLAVFAPFVRLGLVVVDEEHDPSYKQFEGVPYSARDLAVWRARRWNVPIVLGSATPSLESWASCEAGRYRRVALSARASGQPLPTIELIDTAQTPAEEGVSAPLAQAIEATLARGEQALVFLNRRGYAPVVRCGHCGWVSRCPNCSVNLVFHRDDGRMHCHHCGYRETPPRACPECGALDLQPVGRGTQRLEERLQALFPQARIARIDRDAVRTLAQWETLLEEVRAGRYDLLVGTQMMAKGHDFPSLTLVGVIGADAGLYAAEVRATERMFQQLIQVAGRAGRAGAPGRVLVQTEFPQHPLFRELAAHDYAAFAARTLAERRALRLPPFAFQALLRADDEALEPALAFL